ncbi:uncharacterized calcium-binding protein At1g02270-like isoform X2 [Malania oleifera]|uniref:uncharacterized calcium-binding protein At1g02270-like isoform X2 n=1 Tax=Malania oleifera TaxID=397392 RepID=UPI0025ADFE7F|nr:uncharacterized calcium-binding protein At1g02270-like isoform X2 [Malania oleifera]
MNISNGESVDHGERLVGSTNCSGCVSCTTFNILAPIYKRLSSGRRESEFTDFWLTRNESILDRLLNLKSSIICLQEFWLGNEELAGMYEKRLVDAGYVTYKLARTNNRGLLTAVHQNYFHVLNYKELLFNDIGDRVAQLLHIELLAPFSRSHAAKMDKEVLVVNTHLIFPHNSSYCFLRLQQVYKILQYVESYSDEYQCSHIPIILCGDWNGSKKGHVYKFLKSQGFVSSYDIAHHRMSNDDDSPKWVSHRNHRGNICGVDFIWLRNPTNFWRPLKECYMEAVLGNIMHLLENCSTDDLNPLHFFKTDGSYITYSQFTQTLNELGLTGHCYDGLSDEDIKNLWEHLDPNKKGVVDLSHLTRAWSPWSFFHQTSGNEDNKAQIKRNFSGRSLTTVGFNVQKATLFPPEVAKGMWPEHYSLSDHAQLTVEFCPVMMHCT